MTAVQAPEPRLAPDAAGTAPVTNRPVPFGRGRHVGLLLGAVALVALGTVPGFALASVITGWSSTIVALLAALLGVALVHAIGVVARRGHRAAGIATGGAVLVAAVALVALVAARPGPGVDGAGSARRGPLAGAADAAVHGWSSLATSPVPADPGPRTLLPIAVVVLLTAAGATVLARRRPDAATALVPGVLAVALAAVAAGRHAHAPALTGLAVLGSGALLLATRSSAAEDAAGPARAAARRPASIARSVGPAAAVVALTAVGATVVGPRLTLGRNDHPFDPRDHVTAPTVPTGTVSPLDLATGRRRHPDQPMFTLSSTDQVPTRLVALDSYDGVRWTTSSGYERTGSVVTMPRRTNVDVATVRATIHVDGLTGPWLPSVGDPRRISGAGVLLDPSSGSLLAAGGDAAAAAYTIDADVVVPDLARVQSLPVATDEPATMSVPLGLPAPLQQMATVATAAATSPLAKAVLLERYLRLTFTIDEKAATGQSYGHLLRALTAARSGSDEEFALAFAVLARAVGLPTRVVVGFGPGTPTSAGTVAVRSGDARVWPEVKFDGAGWIAFDPVPLHGQQDDATTKALGDAPPPVTVPDDPQSARPTDDQPGAIIEPPLPGVPGGRATSALTRLATAAGVAVATAAVLALLAAFAVAVAKRRRTARRRTAGNARQQVLGAWHDVLDRMTETGVAGADRRTVEDLVEDAEPSTSALAGLYRPVTRALYDDGDGDGTTEADAAQAWKARDRYVNAIRRDAATARRLRWAVDPRSLQNRPGSRPAHPAARHSVPVGGADGRSADPVALGVGGKERS